MTTKKDEVGVTDSIKVTVTRGAKKQVCPKCGAEVKEVDGRWICSNATCEYIKA
jgi:ribosomal protein S27AE